MESPTTTHDIPRPSNWIFTLTKNTLIVFCKFYLRLSQVGNHYIPKEGPVLVAASHRSFMDPPVVSIMGRRPMFFMARHDLFEIPYLGTYIRNLNAYPVRRGEMDRKALKVTFDLLNRGEVVMIFPEGTRSMDGNLQPPSAGIGMILYKAKVPVIPAYEEGSYEAFPRHVKFPYPKKVRIHFGPPIDLSKYYAQPSSREVYDAITEEVMRHIAMLIPPKSN